MTNPPSSLSNFQEIFLMLISIPFTLLSIFGSVTIICMAYKTRRFKKWSTYTRLLVAMSCNDIIFSIVVSMSSFLVPKETSNRVWAFGNATTCSAMGALIQFSYSGVMYNGMLSYYFLLAARYGWKRRVIARRVEPFMHLVSLGYPLSTAISGVVLGVYHETELGQSCWVANYPENCGDGPGESGEPCKSTILAYIFGGLMAAFVLFSLLFNNISILLFVRKQVPPEWRKQWQVQKMGTEVFNKPNESVLEDMVVAKSTQLDDATKSKELSTGTGDVEAQTPVVEIGTRQGSSGALSSGAFAEQMMIQNKQEMDQCIRREQVERLQLVASQSYLYVAAFLITMIWPVGLRILESLDFSTDNEDKLFILLLLQQILLPVQGLLNLLVYARPKYLKCRRDFPEESRWFAFRRAVYGDEVKPAGNSRVDAEEGEPSVEKGRAVLSAESPGKPQKPMPMAARRGLGFASPPSPKGGNPQTDGTPEKQASGSVASSRGSSSSNKNSGSSSHSKQGMTFARFLPRGMVSSLTASQGDFSTGEGQDDEVGLGAPPPRQRSLTSGWTAIRLTGALISSLTASGNDDDYDDSSETELEEFDQSLAPPAATPVETTRWTSHDQSKGTKGKRDRPVFYSDLTEPLESVVENPYEDEADESCSLGSSSRDRFEVGRVEPAARNSPPKRRNTLTKDQQDTMPSVEAIMVMLDDDPSSSEFIDPSFDRMDVTNHSKKSNGASSSIDAPMSLPSRNSSSSEQPDFASTSSDTALRIPVRATSCAETPEDDTPLDRMDISDHGKSKKGTPSSSAGDAPINVPVRATSIAEQMEPLHDGPMSMPTRRESAAVPQTPDLSSIDAHVRLPNRQVRTDVPPPKVDAPMRLPTRPVSSAFDDSPPITKNILPHSVVDAPIPLPTRRTSSTALQPTKEDLRAACFTGDLSASEAECLHDMLQRF